MGKARSHTRSILVPPLGNKNKQSALVRAATHAKEKEKEKEKAISNTTKHLAGRHVCLVVVMRFIRFELRGSLRKQLRTP